MTSTSSTPNSTSASASARGSPVSSNGGNTAWEKTDALENSPLVDGVHHINFLVPPNTLHLAQAFYAGTLGMTRVPAPPSTKGLIGWFNIGNSGQQLHLDSREVIGPSQMKAQTESSRHPCFRVSSQEKLDLVQRRIREHYMKGGDGAPMDCDDLRLGNKDKSGLPGEFACRFFARDYAGNRIEFSV